MSDMGDDEKRGEEMQQELTPGAGKMYAGIALAVLGPLAVAVFFLVMT